MIGWGWAGRAALPQATSKLGHFVAVSSDCVTNLFELQMPAGPVGKGTHIHDYSKDTPWLRNV